MPPFTEEEMSQIFQDYNMLKIKRGRICPGCQEVPPGSPVLSLWMGYAKKRAQVYQGGFR